MSRLNGSLAIMLFAIAAVVGNSSAHGETTGVAPAVTSAEVETVDAATPDPVPDCSYVSDPDCIIQCMKTGNSCVLCDISCGGW